MMFSMKINNDKFYEELVSTEKKIMLVLMKIRMHVSEKMEKLEEKTMTPKPLKGRILLKFLVLTYHHIGLIKHLK